MLEDYRGGQILAGAMARLTPEDVGRMTMSTDSDSDIPLSCVGILCDKMFSIAEVGTQFDILLSLRMAGPHHSLGFVRWR